MKTALTLLVACILCSCASNEGRTGVVGQDGQIIWDQPGVTLYGEPIAQPEPGATVQTQPSPQWRTGTIVGPGPDVHTWTDYGNGHGMMSGRDGVITW
jgi:hypothetical protein